MRSPKSSVILSKLLRVLTLVLVSTCTYGASTKPSKGLQKVSGNVEEQKLCLKEMLYYEARGTSVVEMQKVLDVAVNRVYSARYPNSFCEVIRQPWQYSYRNHIRGSSEIILPKIQSIQGIYDRIAWYRIWGLVESRFTKSGKVRGNAYLSKDTKHYCKRGKCPWWAERSKLVRSSFKTQHEFFDGVR